MLNENEIKIMERLGCKIQPKPLNYNNRRTTFLMAKPDGKTLDIYENWLDFDADYQAGLIPIGYEGGVQITNPDEWLNGPGDTCDAIWEWIHEDSLAITWLTILAIVLIGVIANLIVWQINAIMHPCSPKEIPLPHNRKEIVNTDCTHYILDLETGKVIEEFGGASWLPWVVGGIVVVAIIWLLSQSGILGAAGERLRLGGKEEEGVKRVGPSTGSSLTQEWV